MASIITPRLAQDGAEESQGRGYAAAERHSGAPPRARASRVDLRARYWSFLFDNFHRAVDELYCTCETDDSVAECQVRVCASEARLRGV